MEISQKIDIVAMMENGHAISNLECILKNENVQKRIEFKSGKFSGDDFVPGSWTLEIADDKYEISDSIIDVDNANEHVVYIDHIKDERIFVDGEKNNCIIFRMKRGYSK